MRDSQSYESYNSRKETLMTTPMFPADRFPAPRMRGKPGDSVTPETVYPGCRVVEKEGASDSPAGVFLGFGNEGHTFVCRWSDDNDSHFDYSDQYHIAPDNPESVIGVGEWAVHRGDGVIDRVWAIDGDRALLQTVIGQPRWRPLATLNDRYAWVGTRSECEAWVEANKPRPKRYEYREDDEGYMGRIYDLVTGKRLDYVTIADLLNARDDQRKDTNA